MRTINSTPIEYDTNKGRILENVLKDDRFTASFQIKCT